MGPWSWRSWRGRALALTTVAVVVVVEVLLSGMYPVPLLRATVHCASTSSSVAPERLQCLVAEVVDRDAGVQGASLAVATGDGSFEWSGAAGRAVGSFLYYDQARDLYLAGSVNTTASPVAPFVLMAGAMTLFPAA